MRQFLMGNQILAYAARDAGAKIFFGYPITPSTEILETWISFCGKSGLKYLQNEDEMSAGFATIGSCLAGVPAFIATAGPGNILMQDAFVMAEALRVPIVSIITQRGGMSTSTVIYSQEEVRMTCFGGNSEGFRIVYSTAGLQELYDYTIKAFRVAWQYHWPTFILADGYQAKMKGEVNINSKSRIQKSKLFKPILKQGVNLRNCYNLEEEVGEILVNYSDEYNKMRSKIEEYEEYQTKDAQIIILAHGIVAAAAKMAVDKLRNKGIAAGLFRPITLRPFPTKPASKILGQAKQILVIESALGQLAELFKSELYWINVPLTEIHKPSMGFTPEEIYKQVCFFADAQK